MMKRMKWLLVSLALVCTSAFGQSAVQVYGVTAPNAQATPVLVDSAGHFLIGGAFQATGNTITFTANVSGSIPTPVQAVGTALSQQYLITNIGSNIVLVSYATTSAVATAGCIIPTATTQAVIPVLAFSQIIITTANSSYFTGITSSGTSVVYVTPGVGL